MVVIDDVVASGDVELAGVRAALARLSSRGIHELDRFLGQARLP
jgi:hypothetical protein